MKNVDLATTEPIETGSPLKKALFLHTQKTAGTSIIQMARLNYGNENVISHNQYLDVDAGKFNELKFISGHFGHDFMKDKKEGRYSFTFLRDPVERLLSLYSFCRSRTTEEFGMYILAKQLDVEHFLLAGEGWSDQHRVGFKETVWNHQTWQLCHGWSRDVNDPGRATILDFSEEDLIERAVANLLEFDYVGFAETFDADVAHIVKNLGMAHAGPPPKVNVSEARINLSDLTWPTIKRLNEFTALDKEVYRRAWERRRSA